MNLVKWLFGQTCSHRFAWPRNDGTGGHYQTCLVCGTAVSRVVVAGRSTHFCASCQK